VGEHDRGDAEIGLGEAAALAFQTYAQGSVDLGSYLVERQDPLRLEDDGAHDPQ